VKLSLVPPAGCTLTPSGLADQTQRAAALRGAVEQVEEAPGVFHVAFGPGVDRDAVAELIAIERGCCSFLAIDYDERRRVLSVASEDRDAVAALGRLFTGLGAEHA
jgi:hypothetical protein